MVSWAHDESKTHDAGKYQINRSGLLPVFAHAFPASALINVDFPTFGIPTTIALTGRFKIPRFLSLSIFSLHASWSEYFREKGFSVVKVNSKKGGGIKSINGVIQEACKEKIERDRKRGILNRPVRAMVVGIPNVGKSTFINALAGKACAKTGNKPGVTKGKQWIRLNKNVELLDTPGILWPRFEDQAVGLKLAFIGSIKDEILQTEELAAELVKFMNENYPGVLENKYNVEEDTDPYGMLEKIAESRHCLVRGNELDTEKASVLLMDDFRNGRLGKLTLEYPDAY